MDWVKAIAIIMVCTSIQMFFLRLNGTLKPYWESYWTGWMGPCYLYSCKLIPY